MSVAQRSAVSHGTVRSSRAELHVVVLIRVFARPSARMWHKVLQFRTGPSGAAERDREREQAECCAVLISVLRGRQCECGTQLCSFAWGRQEQQGKALQRERES
eukprot:1402448-Alexandrium_andersonii.AAC.1